MSTSNGHFIPPAAGYGRPSPPTVRRRIVAPPESAEPDRAFIENAPPPQNEPTLRSKPEPEQAPTERQASSVAKKKRVKLSDEQKSIAVARVEALVGAGEQLKKAVVKVGKEMGAAPLSVRGWVFKARESKPAPARAGKKVTRRKPSEYIPPPATNGSPVHALAQVDVLAEQLIASLASMARTIVREEIRRMLA